MDLVFSGLCSDIKSSVKLSLSFTYFIQKKEMLQCTKFIFLECKLLKDRRLQVTPVPPMVYDRLSEQ